MTLEKLIDFKTDIWLREYTYKAAEQTRNECAQAFNAGCKEMLSELKPVMEELQTTLKNLEPFCDERLRITTQSNASSIVFQFNKEVITVSHLKQIKSALSKYNELFKK